MDIDLVFKIAAVGIVVAVLNQLLVRSDRPDQAIPNIRPIFPGKPEKSDSWPHRSPQSMLQSLT